MLTCSRCPVQGLSLGSLLVPGEHEAVGPLPRNPNGKNDRKLLATQWLDKAA